MSFRRLSVPSLSRLTVVGTSACLIKALAWVQVPVPDSFRYSRSSQPTLLTPSGFRTSAEPGTDDPSLAIVSGFCWRMEPIGRIRVVFAPISQRISLPIHPRCSSTEPTTYHCSPTDSRPYSRTELLGQAFLQVYLNCPFLCQSLTNYSDHPARGLGCAIAPRTHGPWQASSTVRPCFLSRCDNFSDSPS